MSNALAQLGEPRHEGVHAKIDLVKDKVKLPVYGHFVCPNLLPSRETSPLSFFAIQRLAKNDSNFPASLSYCSSFRKNTALKVNDARGLKDNNKVSLILFLNFDYDLKMFILVRS